jgi:protein-disulfide isomerase
MSAAQATEGAAKQGKFWDLYRLLFAGTDKELSEEYIEDCAKKTGIDMAKFKLDRVEDKVKTDILNDLEYGRSLNVTSTPTFIVKEASGKVTTFVGGKDFRAAMKKMGM